MPAQADHRGRPASPGFAAGPVFIATEKTGRAYVRAATPDAEIEVLTHAIENATSSLGTLLDSLEGEASEMVEFQLAMLSDDTFFARALERIRSGGDAAASWAGVLDEEIAGYLASDDEYFRARSADLADIRNRVLAVLTGTGEAAIPAGAIYVADDITPTVFLAHDWTGGGIALRSGSITSHVAMLARSRGVPAIVGIGDDNLVSGATALLDAEEGLLVIDPSEDTLACFERDRATFDRSISDAAERAFEPAVTANGESVAVLVNIADPSEVDGIDIVTVDGVGLMRTEFLFGGEHGLPDEETQYRAYRKVLDWAAEKPVTIRTADIGGDKPVEGLSAPEDNAFLGVRGIRLSLRRPEVFRTQVRALLRSATHGDLKVMLPMVSIPGEIDQSIALFEQERNALEAEGIACAMPKIGIMVEVPSVAVLPQRFARAAFFSIGSNDLTQYALAVSRDNSDLADLADTADPSVIALITNVVSHAAKAGIEVSLCGDAGGDTRLVPLLLDTGLRSLSVAATRIGVVKAAIRIWQPDGPGNDAGKGA